MKISARILNLIFISTGLVALVALFIIPGFLTASTSNASQVIAYVYPNPVLEPSKMKLRVETLEKLPFTAKIFDLSGQLLSSHQIKKEHIVASPNSTIQSYELGLEHNQLKSGIYFGVVSNNDIQHNFRFTVVK